MSSVDVPQLLRLDDFVSEPQACHVASRQMRAGGGLPPLHTHDFAEVFWIAHGRALHGLAGEVRPMQAGDLVLVAPGDVHRFATQDGRGYRIVNVAFAQRHWRALTARYDPKGDLMDRPSAARAFRLAKNELGALEHFAAELLSGRRDIRALDRFLMNLMYLIADRTPMQDHCPQPPWLRHALRAMGKGEHLERGTPALVQLCDRSAEHVARECRRWLGKTPTAVVNDLRLDAAAERLADQDTAVVDVATEVGFSNLSHFYRLFRQRFSATPAQYRAVHHCKAARIFGVD